MGKKDNKKKSENQNYPIDCYANREVSWLKFNERVLEEAYDTENPLCERLNFLDIFQTNLDEFFMVRTGTLYDERKSDVRDNKTRLTSREQLEIVLSTVRKMLKSKDKCYHALVDELVLNGVQISEFDDLSTKEKRQMAAYFQLHILPLLSPQIVSEKQPFPFINNGDIYTVALLKRKADRRKKDKKKDWELGIIPSSGSMFKRLVQVSPESNHYILVEDLIRAFAPAVFSQYRVINTSLIRLVRNADISIDDDRPDDLELKKKDYRKAVEKMIATRKRMGAIKLEYAGKIDSNLINIICDYLDLPKKHAFYSDAPLDLSFVYTISDQLSKHKELFYAQRSPQLSPDVSESKSMISQIKKKDIMLSYPYESMRPFIRLLTEAAADPDVISIRITLYRVAKISQIVSALSQAAENGKEVTALVELRARFDESNNVDQSHELENSGCHVIYGLDNIKVHSKLCLITRKGSNGIEYITQVGTGNFNEKTARLYTDYCLMTANRGIGEEAANVFNALALGETVDETKLLLIAPNCLQNEIIERLDTQIGIAKAGKPAYAGFKLNSLTDKTIIDKLIEASSAGVKIQLLVRGICCIVAGVPGLTDNIEVYSIVGRYLEHGRIYIFGCNGNEEVFISSADFMTRNTTRRVEAAVPILNSKVRARLLNDFRLMLSDTCKLRTQLDDGSYVKVKSEDSRFNVQEFFAEESYRRAGIPLPEEEQKPKSTKAPKVTKEAKTSKAPKATKTTKTTKVTKTPKATKKTKTTKTTKVTKATKAPKATKTTKTAKTTKTVKTTKASK